MSVLYFVTPAWQRFELTAVCLQQRQRVIDDLAQHGIEAHQVVVADDENLDIARSMGMHTVEQNNDGLGRRWNDGNVYAAEHGAEWFVPIGSDSWIDPAYFYDLPRPKYTRTSGLYAVVADKLLECNVTSKRLPAGPYVFHRSTLEPSGFRPTEEANSKHTDHSTLAGLGRIRWEHKDLHPLQYVGFRQEPMMTSYASLKRRWGVREHDDPWHELAQHYPLDLVEKARAVLSSAQEETPLEAA